MGAALDRLWTRFLPETEARINLLEDAAKALMSPGLDARAACREAHQAAHKLAGTLGTFGLQYGTEIAHWVETALEEGTESPSASELASRVAELRSLVRQRAAGHDQCCEGPMEKCQCSG
jgi:HPt (histidine-containing phosphotransfer) domain-containing protein